MAAWAGILAKYQSLSAKPAAPRASGRAYGETAAPLDYKHRAAKPSPANHQATRRRNKQAPQMAPLVLSSLTLNITIAGSARRLIEA